VHESKQTGAVTRACICCLRRTGHDGWKKDGSYLANRCEINSCKHSTTSPLVFSLSTSSCGHHYIQRFPMVSRNDPPRSACYNTTYQGRSTAESRKNTIATCAVFRRYRARISLVSIGITRSNDPLLTAEQFLLHCRRVSGRTHPFLNIHGHNWARVDASFAVQCSSGSSWITIVITVQISYHTKQDLIRVTGLRLLSWEEHLTFIGSSAIVFSIPAFDFLHASDVHPARKTRKDTSPIHQ
jgi:hypothetical protein